MYSYVYTGKKSGYVATCHIKKGTILLQEKPALWIDKRYSREASRRIQSTFDRKYLRIIAETLLDCKFIIEIFENLSQQDQDSILEMSYFYQSSPEDMEVLRTFLQMLSGSYMMTEKLRVCSIFQTHQHRKCLYVNASKFNHSCAPNAEIFTLEGTTNIEVKAVRHIGKGEEICLDIVPECYLRNERRTFLKNTRNMECDCEICELKGDDFEKDEVIRREFGMLMKEVKTTHISQEHKLSLLLRMYTISRNYEGVSNRVKLEEILEQSFEVSKKCFLGSLNPYYRQVSQYVAKEGLYLAGCLHGEKHTNAEKWRKRSRNMLTIVLPDTIKDVDFPRASGFLKVLLLLFTLFVFEDDLICLII